MIEPAKGKIQGGNTAEIQVGILLKKMRGESLLQYGVRDKGKGIDDKYSRNKELIDIRRAHGFAQKGVKAK